MDEKSGPFPRLVDTVALSALASTSLSDLVFSEVKMTVTRCCHQELKRGAADGEKHIYRKSCEEALAQIRKNRGENIDLYPTGVECKNKYGYLKDNIGEITIARALDQHSDFKLVISFDEDVIDEDGGMSDELKKMFKQEIPRFDVFPANEPLYRLYREGEINEIEFESATSEMIGKMDWKEASSVELFWTAYPGYSPS